MYIHTDLSQRLANSTIEEALSPARRAAALRAAALGAREPAATGLARPQGASLPVSPTGRRWRVRRPRLRADAPSTTTNW
jgi:hypothetical protein